MSDTPRYFIEFAMEYAYQTVDKELGEHVYLWSALAEDKRTLTLAVLDEEQMEVAIDFKSEYSGEHGEADEPYDLTMLHDDWSDEWNNKAITIPPPTIYTGAIGQRIGYLIVSMDKPDWLINYSFAYNVAIEQLSSLQEITL